MVEVALSMAVIILIGITFILFRAGWDMHRKIDDMEDYITIVTAFSHEISGLPKDEVKIKFNEFLEEKHREAKKRELKRR